MLWSVLKMILIKFTVNTDQKIYETEWTKLQMINSHILSKDSRQKPKRKKQQKLLSLINFDSIYECEW